MGVSPVYGYHFGDPKNKCYDILGYIYIEGLGFRVFWDLYIYIQGSPSLGNYHIMLVLSFLV